jgi:hypothetical protein
MTIPSGDDGCTDRNWRPNSNQICKGDITVDLNGIPETAANNQYRRFTAVVTSGYRNPAYNRFIKSTPVASGHVLGFALDIGPGKYGLPGLNQSDYACLIKLASDTIPGVRRAAAEWTHKRIQCNATVVRNPDHVHNDVGKQTWLNLDQADCQVPGTGDLGVNFGERPRICP